MPGSIRAVAGARPWAWLAVALWLASCAPTPNGGGYVPPGAGVPPTDGGASGGREEPPGRVIAVSGPETAGSVVVIRGRRVRLPPDVYVSAYYVAVDCMPGTSCPNPPVLELRRGEAVIVLEERTGRVVQRSGPAEAWDFLRGIVREGGGAGPR